ncbi:MAG: Linocin bacteriocin protein [Actinomycetia bacterium]|nr:Linocin bacteriocin protein [Actinomycetes bacterium]
MNHLHRELAPISSEAWDQIETEASRTLRHYLVARRIVDFSGPLGWEHAAEPTGRTTDLEAPADNVEARMRQVQPLIELRAPFAMPRAEIDAIAAGARDADLDPVRDAARHLALIEDGTVFEGYAAGQIAGIGQRSPYPAVGITDNYADYPSLVARAVATLQQEGVGGPYALALGPRCYTGVVETTESGGYPLLEHVRLILGGPVFWAPAVDGAIVLSTRGGDYALTVGQDVSIGYLQHDAASVSLYLEESIAFRVLSPEAAVPLRYGG